MLMLHNTIKKFNAYRLSLFDGLNAYEANIRFGLQWINDVVMCLTKVAYHVTWMQISICQ